MPRSSRSFASVLMVILVLVIVGCSPAAPTTAPTTAPPISQPTAAPTSPPAPATPTTVAQALQPCSTGGLAVSSLQTPVPVTPAPTNTPTLVPTLAPNAPTPTPRPPTATPRPAPQVDRVGFPDGYQNNFKFLYVSDRVDNRQIRYVCGNDTAASVKPGQPFPYGSIIAFESWTAKADSGGNVIKDSNGHLIREALTVVFVMRKEQGFGEAYQNLRNGEWEYVAYRPDKSVQTPPQLTTSCTACHLGAGQERDWVFHGNLIFEKDHYIQNPPVGANEIEMWSMAFYPRPLSVKVGTSVKWINRDGTAHTVTANDKSFDSGTRAPGTDFSFTFTKAGTYDYICSIHPLSMSARIEVKE